MSVYIIKTTVFYYMHCMYVCMYVPTVHPRKYFSFTNILLKLIPNCLFVQANCWTDVDGYFTKDIIIRSNLWYFLFHFFYKNKLFLINSTRTKPKWVHWVKLVITKFQWYLDLRSSVWLEWLLTDYVIVKAKARDTVQSFNGHLHFILEKHFECILHSASSCA